LYQAIDMFHALIVSDDAESTLRQLQYSLCRLGCRVHSAQSTESAVKELTKNPYDIVFAELCLKQGGGRSVGRWLKQMGLRTKFFIVTSWKGELEKEILRSDGISDIIHKPIIFNELRDKMLEHFG